MKVQSKKGKSVKHYAEKSLDAPDLGSVRRLWFLVGINPQTHLLLWSLCAASQPVMGLKEIQRFFPLKRLWIRKFPQHSFLFPCRGFPSSVDITPTIPWLWIRENLRNYCKTGKFSVILDLVLLNKKEDGSHKIYSKTIHLVFACAKGII